MNNPPEIVIHIKGGVAEVMKKPLGVVLRLVDFDKPSSVEPRTEEVWTANDMTTGEDERA